MAVVSAVRTGLCRLPTAATTPAVWCPSLARWRYHQHVLTAAPCSSSGNCSPSGRAAAVVARAERDGSGSKQEEERPVVYNTEFGYSRKDIFLIGGSLIGLGYALYYGLQAFGVEPGIAGNWVQATIFLGICVGYISTYVFRVATKQMTYAKQLEQYEEAVMRKRLEEMTDADVQRMMNDEEQKNQPRGGAAASSTDQS